MYKYTDNLKKKKKNYSWRRPQSVALEMETTISFQDLKLYLNYSYT